MASPTRKSPRQSRSRSRSAQRKSLQRGHSVLRKHQARRRTQRRSMYKKKYPVPEFGDAAVITAADEEDW